MAEKKKEICFEENLKELEEIVKKLESGDVSLDEMLELFEQGIARTKECTAQLKKAEQKINILIKNNDGEIEEKPFDAE